MVLKRTDSDDTDRNSGPAIAIETLRSGYSHAVPKVKGDEEKVSVFWRIFGGTILSIVALAGITLYNNLTTNIAELRAEVSRLNEGKAEWAKKDDVQSVRTQLTTQAGYRGEIDSLKERASKARAESDSLRKEVAAIEGVKEKLIALAADFKAVLDETNKIRQELAKNQAGDLSRQEFRDAQMKKLDDTVKEIQKALSEAREKIARLEGQQVPMKASGIPPTSKD
jgi:chromosome segregation ATPase